MTPPDSTAETPAAPVAGARPAGSIGHLSPTELLHRHLTDRVAGARERVRFLEQQRHAPDLLVTRFGATVADAQRLLDEERVDADVRGAALARVVEARSAELLAEAEAEAHVLRAVAVWLLQVQSFRPAPRVAPAPAVHSSTRVSPEFDTPVLVRVEARAS
jgi:hypothetical protein